MKKVVYSCPFVPAEWIRAHGLQPSRIMPHPIPAAAGPRTGVCPYAWAFVQTVLADGSARAVVFTTVCDQMRRASELIARDGDVHMFLMNVPATWQTAAAHELYASELKRLGRFLVRIGGAEPSAVELADVIRRYETQRAALRAAHGHLSPLSHWQAVASFHSAGGSEVEVSGRPHVPRGIRLALVGGPMMTHHGGLFELIEGAGGSVVLDATTNGERTTPAPFDRRTLDDAPLRALADSYFGSIPDAFRRPNSELYRWLKSQISERDVQGVVFRHYTWCDTWQAEAQRMKEWCEVPLLVTTAGADEQPDRHTASRIESFIEMLR